MWGTIADSGDACMNAYAQYSYSKKHHIIDIIIILYVPVTVSLTVSEVILPPSLLIVQE